MLRLYTVFITRTLKFMYCLDEKCPDGWTNFGVKCYKYFPHSVNWITAEVMCCKAAGRFYLFLRCLKQIFLQIANMSIKQIINHTFF